LLVQQGFDPRDVARTLIQSFLRHALRDGFFHADMHQGNLFIDLEGRIAAVDFGIMGRLGLKERRFLAEILYGFITRNYRRVAEVHFEAGYVPPLHRVEDFALAIRAIGEPIHSRTADQISMARLLRLLFEVTALFDMTTRIELVMLQKTMVVVEGVARRLDPRLNMWATAEPVVGAWIAENLGPRGKIEDLGRAAKLLAHMVASAPDRLDNVGRLIERGEAAAEASIRADEKEIREGGALVVAALWVIALLLALIWFRL
jgi:ubiquinone biosynthesis protein